MTNEIIVEMAIEGHASTRDAIRWAMNQEREACAKVCEETTASWTQHLYNEGCIDCAKAIRARGQA